jgi:hypothetical protein
MGVRNLWFVLTIGLEIIACGTHPMPDWPPDECP